MIADWCVEAAAESPRIVVPWPGWLDLRVHDARKLAEACSYPELMPLLQLANRGGLVSSKVDVFALTAAEADPELEDEWGERETQSGLGSYLDVLPSQAAREGDPKESFGRAEHAARQTASELRKMRTGRPLAAEIVVRPAVLWDQASWGLSVYAMGFGPDAEQARAAWAQAAEQAVTAACHMLRYVGE